ncbi:hypothetical protein JYB87_07195 [Shewanella avicenniae]|uniref:Uncharacterized protein n=1 Tax=Shewanella avicenniae TaxID=2814294 RepID=A0ABX7QVP6_9GAMM|nr:hypothetical protein [Shewanella avicenniae]QSX34995.1 hypothetical protein JYB87_07195 [Shewanella avicenniae]
MKTSILVGLLSSLIAASAWAVAPGEKANGSTTISISDALMGTSTCLTSRPPYQSNSASATSQGAFADAISAANSYMMMSYAGDVYVDLTRHGKNGAVQQVALNAGMGSGTIFAQVVNAQTSVSADSEAIAKEQIEVNADAIAGALKSWFLGINRGIKIGSLDYTVMAGAHASLGSDAIANAAAKSSAEAEAEAEATGESRSSSSADGNINSSNSSSFYIQGVNIEQFNAHMNAASGTILNVQTTALAQTYANALATSLVYSLARASAEAEYLGKLSFEYDLPIIGQGQLPIISDPYSASKVAMVIAGNVQEISSFADAAAAASAFTLTGSSIEMELSVHYENVPGTDDILEIYKVGDLTLDCNHVTTNADAGAMTNME